MDEALVRKLKLPPSGKIAVMLPPEGFLEAIGRSGAESEPSGEPGTYDYVQLFADSVAVVERYAPDALKAVKPDGLLWICYPKGTSKLKTDLNRDKGWETVTAAGWEGVSLISIDDTWSAMRFRPRGASGRSSPSPADRRQAGAPSAPIPTPDDLERALAANPEAAAFFAKLAPSHRKEYVNWIVEAKKAETRASRIEKTVEKLQAGLKRPSDKL